MTTPAKPTGPSRTEQRLKDTIRKAKVGATEPADVIPVPTVADATAAPKSATTPRKRAVSAASPKPAGTASAPEAAASGAASPAPFSHPHRRDGRVWPD
jgi:hypothetical protein